MLRSIREVSRALNDLPSRALTCGNCVSEGGLEPPCPFRGTSTSS
jgi:hypothetical protein